LDSLFDKPSDDADLSKIAEDVLSFLKISDIEIIATILKKRMQSEFNMQITNLHYPEKVSEIVLKINNTEVKIGVQNNERVELLKHVNLRTEVIYIDDPYALDNINAGNRIRFNPNTDFSTHREHLIECLSPRIKKALPSVKEAFDEIMVMF
jgi:hypothetical protein